MKLQKSHFITSNLKICILSSLLISTKSLGFIVAIDPGHGGQETGAIFAGTKEADLNLKVGKILNQLLTESQNYSFKNFSNKDNANPSLSAFLTRDADQTLSLQERVEIAQNKKADMFISLHANSVASKNVSGAEIYFQGGLSEDEEQEFLAYESERTQNELTPVLGSILVDLKKQDKLFGSLWLSRQLKKIWPQDSLRVRIRQAPFYVISKTKIPSILVEMGFMTNRQELQQLKNPIHQKKIADAIAITLAEYLKHKSK